MPLINQLYCFFWFTLDFYPHTKNDVMLLEYLQMLPFLIQSLIVSSLKKNNSSLNN